MKAESANYSIPQGGFRTIDPGNWRRLNLALVALGQKEATFAEARSVRYSDGYEAAAAHIVAQRAARS